MQTGELDRLVADLLDGFQSRLEVLFGVVSEGIELEGDHGLLRDASRRFMLRQSEVFINPRVDCPRTFVVSRFARHAVACPRDHQLVFRVGES